MFKFLATTELRTKLDQKIRIIIAGKSLKIKNTRVKMQFTFLPD